MKKSSLLAVALLVLLTACGGGEGAGPTPQELARDILAGQTDGEGLTALADQAAVDHLAAFGLAQEEWSDCAIYVASGVDAREVTVLRLGEDADPERVAEAMEGYLSNRLAAFVGYVPEAAALLERGAVVTHGSYAALLVCTDMEAARAAFADGFGQAALSPTELPLPTETAASDDFFPFDPPNETDMTLYDTTAILAAWHTGETAGLAEKDREIYEVCRELFDRLITAEMTELEKETSLHDWLIAHGGYDKTIYDDPNHIGRPNNRDPYGLLVEGYGICLAYASSFQLLMDLAQVECITVVGASSNSTSDHAWNMVKLEGEWYCVDPTWNDPSQSEGKPVQEASHTFFNVSSEFMRQTNHQWDYDAVPETGPRPPQ